MPNTDRQAQRLRDAGLRVTAARVAILAELAGDPGHPGAEELFAALRPRHPSLSLSTVYHTLETLLRAGLIRRAPAGTGRLRVDGTADDHDHAVCRSCGAIFDVDRGRLPRPRLPRKLPDGQAVEGIRIEYLVRCTACRGNTDQPSA